MLQNLCVSKQSYFTEGGRSAPEPPEIFAEYVRKHSFTKSLTGCRGLKHISESDLPEAVITLATRFFCQMFDKVFGQIVDQVFGQVFGTFSQANA